DGDHRGLPRDGGKVRRTMKLYYFPLSGYSMKVLTALYEKDIAFTPVIVDLFDPAARAEFDAVSPFGKVPVAVLDNGHVVPESSIIVEYLDTHYDQGPRLLPVDRDLARQTRFQDRVADTYVMEQLVKIVTDGNKPEKDRDPSGVARAKTTLDR